MRSQSSVFSSSAIETPLCIHDPPSTALRPRARPAPRAQRNSGLATLRDWAVCAPALDGASCPHCCSAVARRDGAPLAFAMVAGCSDPDLVLRIVGTLADCMVRLRKRDRDERERAAAAQRDHRRFLANMSHGARHHHTAPAETPSLPRSWRA